MNSAVRELALKQQLPVQQPPLRSNSPNGANGIDLLSLLRLAFVASHSRLLINDIDLSEIARGSSFDERDGSRQAYAIDSATRRDIVERVQDQVELLNELRAKE